MKKIYSILLCYICNTVLAAPLINSTKEVVKNGESITILGNDFGAMNGSIVSWDNFESKTAGSNVGGSSPLIGPTWSLQHTGGSVTYNNIHSHSGNLAANVVWAGSTGIEAFGWAGQGPFRQLYITYWRWMDGNYDPNPNKTPYADNHKQYYLFGNRSSEGFSEFPQGMPLIPAGTSTWGYYNNVSMAQTNWNGTNNINTIGKTYENTKSQWNRWEFWQKLNTDPSCTINVNCDGELTYWIDTKVGRKRADYKHRFVAGEWKDFRLGHMAHGFISTAKAWFDDIYIATTQARVEIGDASTWDTCTHREIQIPSSWQAGQITITINQGSFPAKSSAYLFVVDANGNVSNGKEIKFDDMASPTNFKVQH